MSVNKIRVEKQIGAHLLIRNRLLRQASRRQRLARYGDTVGARRRHHRLAPRPGIDFFPLTCDYRERERGSRQIPRRFI